jgi:citronellol/citronellal dehydrogenase
MGASRGIGEEIAVLLGRLGANLVIVGKTATPHAKLPGTIFAVADAIKSAGGNAHAVQCNIQDVDQIANVFAETQKVFGGVDIVVCNASALLAKPTQSVTAKDWDLVFSINGRGTFFTCLSAIPLLKESSRRGNNPHILTLSPPVRLDWLGEDIPNLAYTMSKCVMTETALGLAKNLKRDGIAVNSLWPKTVIDTAALTLLPHYAQIVSSSRKPAIVADAAVYILSQPSTFTGHSLIDEDALRQAGETDFDRYATSPGHALLEDWYVGPEKI